MFLQQTYWTLAGVVRNASLNVRLLVGGSYPITRMTPGLLRIISATGRVGATTYAASSPLTADYTSSVWAGLPGFQVVADAGVERRSIRLAKPAPRAGAIRFVGHLPRDTTWSISGLARVLSSQARNVFIWDPVAELEFYGSGGLPPGSYTIKTYLVTGETKTHQVVVHAGLITDLIV